MPTLGLNTMELVSTLRTAPLNGAPSSADYNDSQRENLNDLTVIVTFINDTLLPILNALPSTALLPANGPVGLEGRTVYTDSSDQGQLFYDSLAARSLTVADSFRLLNGMIDNFRTTLEDIGVSVGTLRAQLASDSRNDIAIALQNLTNTVNQIVTTQGQQSQQITTLNTSIAGFKRTTQTTGSIAAGIHTVSVTWPTPYPDNSYFVSVTVEDASGKLVLQNFTYQSSGVGIVVSLNNTDSSAHTGTLHILTY